MFALQYGETSSLSGVWESQNLSTGAMKRKIVADSSELKTRPLGPLLGDESIYADPGTFTGYS